MADMETIRARHSVRQYRDAPIEAEKLAELCREAETCGNESGLRFVIVDNDRDAFNSFLAHYGKFSGVSSYIAIVVPDKGDTDERCGYYGERLVLRAQELGLNTCWAALTFAKGAVKKRCAVAPGEKLRCVIALGYGETQGRPHRSKTYDEVTENAQNAPDWFRSGVEAALLAPTAVNQQRFRIAYQNGEANIRGLGGACSKIDLGIVRLHFEIGSGRKTR